MLDCGSEAYNALTKIIKFRFRKQLKDSGIELKGLYSMKNLVTNKEFYLLEVNDIQIRFANEKPFIALFIDFLQKNIIELKSRYNYLINRPTDEFSDQVQIEMQYKQIDYFLTQQTELLKKINEYKLKIPD